MCPRCNIVLVMSEKQGVEIDYCPQCRGIWLDRGELEKILERSFAADSYQQPPLSQHYNKEYGDHHEHHSGHHSRNDSHEYGKHRKKNWLSELFD